MHHIFISLLLVVVIFGGAYISKRGPVEDHLEKKTQAPQEDNNALVSESYYPALDLSSRGISRIPMDVFLKTNLEKLDVSHNKLEGSIQAEIRHLGKLKILDLSHNQLSGVPAEIGQLKDLETLDLSYNVITGLPYELANLRNLKFLDLSGNKYSQVDLEVIRKGLPSTVVIKTK